MDKSNSFCLRPSAAALAILLFVWTSAAQASQATLGTVSGILVIQQGNVFFYQAGIRSGRPACATEDRWVFDGKTATGQLMMSALLTAQATGRRVTLAGTGTCSVWSDTETLGGIQIWD